MSIAPDEQLVKLFRDYYKESVKKTPEEALKVYEGKWLGENSDLLKRNQIIFETRRVLIQKHTNASDILNLLLSNHNSTDGDFYTCAHEVLQINEEVEFLDYIRYRDVVMDFSLTISKKREREASDESPAAKRTAFF